MGRPPIGKVAMTGAERVRLHRLKHAKAVKPVKPASNVIKLSAPAGKIADALLAMDRDRLVNILKLIDGCMKEPPPIPNIPRTETAAKKTMQSDRSYAVQIVGLDGTRQGNSVRVGTREQAQLYANSVPNHFERDSYATTEVVECNEPPLNSVYFDRYRRTMVTFKHGTCGSLTWRPLLPAFEQSIQSTLEKKETAEADARHERAQRKALAPVIEGWIAGGKLSDQQIADYRERGIMPPLRIFTACGMAFDGGPDMESCSVPESTEG
jgi:hypothetical protein